MRRASRVSMTTTSWKAPSSALAIERGGNAPCALNAANEVAVAAYLKGLIGFYDISRINEKCLRGLNFVADPSIEDIFETNAEVARIANGCIS